MKSTPAPVLPHSSPSREFLQALPDLLKVVDDLHQVLHPAMTQGRDEDREFARAAWMLGKALHFLLKAAQPDDPSGFDAALAEVDADVLAAAGHVRCLRAAAATTEELATATERERSTGVDLGDCEATHATISAFWPDDEEGLIHDEVRVDLDAAGRARWNSERHGRLPVDGRTQLELGAILDGFAAIYTRAVWPAGAS